MKTTRLLAIALALPFGASLASAATIVTQYQFNPNGDWFADPPAAPVPGVGNIDLIPHTSSANANNIHNYATTSAITSTTISQPGISGPGLNLMVQTRGAPLIGGTSAASLYLRNNNGRLAYRSPIVGGGGSTLLAWSSSASVALTGLTYHLSLGPSGGTGGVAQWEDGMRLALQDTGGNWHLSDWTSTGQTPVGGTAPVTGTAAGLFEINLDQVEWAAYSAASLDSGALNTFDAGSAAFAPFLGDAQAFGFFMQQHLDNVENNELRVRMQGFQVIPEPTPALLLGLGSVFLGSRRRRV